MGTQATYEFANHGSVTVEDSCGCVYCDIGLEPNTRIKNMFSTDCSAEYFHPTKRGDVRCTKQR